MEILFLPPPPHHIEMPWFLAALPWIVSALTAAGSTAASLRQSKKQNEANMEMAKYSASANQAAIDRQNAYNTPKNQMQRFSEAGLNPNLIYGQGNAGNQSGAPQMPSPGMTAGLVQMPELLSAYQDFQVKRAQVNQINANAENKRAQTATELLKRLNIDVSTQTKKRMLEQFNILAPHQTKITEARANEGVARASMAMSDSFYKNQYADRLWKAKVETDEQRRDAMAADVMFRKHRNEWMKYGVTTSDNVLVRVLSKMAIDSGFGDRWLNMLRK